MAELAEFGSSSVQNEQVCSLVGMRCLLFT
jgi:hypothetical protein